MDCLSNQVPAHHIKQDYCETRPKYRRTRKRTAVRVFTVSVESKYLIASNVPCTGVETELVKLFASFGTVDQHREIEDYPSEEFTKTFLVQYQEIQAAKTAKRFLDERYFFGAMLHVCYAPEYESVAETKAKLMHRLQSVTFRVRFLEKQCRKPSEQPDRTKAERNPFTSNTSKAVDAGPVGTKRTLKQPVHLQGLMPILPAANAVSQPKPAVVPQQPHYFLASCNSVAYPACLPPPPPPDNTHTASTACGTAEQSSNAKPFSSSKKTTFKAKSGYFHQKVVETIRLSSATAVKRQNIENDSSVSEPSSKRKCSFYSPVFLPRQFRKNDLKTKHW